MLNISLAVVVIDSRQGSPVVLIISLLVTVLVFGLKISACLSLVCRLFGVRVSQRWR